MKTPRWLLHLVIIFINFARLAISITLFCNFFLFQIVNVTCLFIFYLLLDSVEGIIVFYQRDIWGPLKIVLYYFNYTVFLFAIIAGITLYLPLFHFLALIGKDTDELYLVHTWIGFAAIIFALTLVFGGTTIKEWGNIQNLGLRSAFLLYCFWYIPWWGIVLTLISVACLLSIEIKKYGWSWKELRKKDIRFRHND